MGIRVLMHIAAVLLIINGSASAGTVRISESHCSDGNTFENVLRDKLSSLGSVSLKSSIIDHDWSAIEQPINDLLASNLRREINLPFTDTMFLKRGQFSYRTYGNSGSHVSTLDKAFGIKVGPGGLVANVREIFAAYKKAMRNEKEVLHPKFIFRLPDHSLIGLEPGEAIPKGAMLEGDVLTEKDFATLLAKGIFPIGNHKISNTGISTFEHDLAHLTAFIESPEYMRLWRKHAMRNITSVTSKINIMQSWEYFLGEGLVIMRDETKAHLNELLAWPLELFNRRDSISLGEVVDHLRALPVKELQLRAERLSSQYGKYTHILGGGGRDPVSYQGSWAHDWVYFLVKHMDYRTGDPSSLKVEEMAKLELFLFNLKDIKLSDWFVTPEEGHNAARMRLQRLILNGTSIKDGAISGNIIDLVHPYWYFFESW
jgi:hypothetical protein